ncbi:peptidoglycan-binding domain-containing protein [Aquibacillus sediminis]|uniref:peptidoglycan-binding domain-containing protein n=1 Tax=Aquibacillus sediminis TaxID=2574734 RepID=UPI001FE3B8D8|nr:peptidoglycan-binding protein [Aquibacillus sediminis]
MDDVQTAYERYFNGNEDISEPAVKGASVDLPVQRGDTGQFVKEIQQDFIKAGFNFPIHGADGSFGPETERAVMRFQRAYNLTIDGLVGPQTLDKLKEAVNSSSRVDEFPLPNTTLQRGDTGPEVSQLQRALKEINFDPQMIDGSYGPLTEDAVTRFQSMYYALENDGIYGPNTRRYIQLELDN